MVTPTKMAVHKDCNPHGSSLLVSPIEMKLDAGQLALGELTARRPAMSRAVHVAVPGKAIQGRPFRLVDLAYNERLW